MFDTNETLYKLEARDIEVRRMRLKKEDQRCVAKIVLFDSLVRFLHQMVEHGSNN